LMALIILIIWVATEWVIKQMRRRNGNGDG
jgi:hypothetical protein